jgi:hypothetical protein
VRVRVEEWFGRQAGVLVEVSRRHRTWVGVAAMLLTAASLALASKRLVIDADPEAMFAKDVPFLNRLAELEAAFPGLDETFAVMVEAAPPSQAAQAADDLAARLARHPEHFQQVFVPGGGAFFEQHGLLCLEIDELEELADDLAAAQPFLAELARDPSLPTLLDLLERAVAEAGSEGLAHLDLAGVWSERPGRPRRSRGRSGRSARTSRTEVAVAWCWRSRCSTCLRSSRPSRRSKPSAPRRASWPGTGRAACASG